MTERKFKSYTLWLKWRGSGWQPYLKCVNLPYPSANPIGFLEYYMINQFVMPYWKRGKTWMILPDNRKPKGAS